MRDIERLFVSPAAKEELGRVKSACWLAAVVEKRSLSTLEQELRVVLGLAEGPMSAVTKFFVEMPEPSMRVFTVDILRQGWRAV